MDNNLLSGLGALGLGNLETLDIYEKVEKDSNADSDSESINVKEEDLIFDKSFECPMCDRTFKAKMLRASKVKVLEPDMDLRPRHEHIDALKYDIIACPHCGYAGYGKGFLYLTSLQRKAIKENICGSYKPKQDSAESSVYSYEEALERHKLALVNTIVKHGKPSEKAYICLKTGWLVRGMAENLSKEEADYETRHQELLQTENQFLKNAYDGLLMARETEQPPIAGMDIVTLDFLLTNLAIRFGEYDMAAKLIATILAARTVPTRIKDKTRELKVTLLQKVREQKMNE